MNSDGFSGNMVEGRMMFKDADSRCSFSFFCMNRSLGVEEGSCSVRGHDNSPPFISNSDPLPGRMGGGVEDWAYAVWQKKTARMSNIKNYYRSRRQHNSCKYIFYLINYSMFKKKLTDIILYKRICKYSVG